MSEVSVRPLDEEAAFEGQFDGLEAPVEPSEVHEYAEFAGIVGEIGRMTLKPLSNDHAPLSRQFIPPTGKATPAAFNSVFEETPPAFQSYV